LGFLSFVFGFYFEEHFMPKYKGGSAVPNETLTEWIRNYKP
jgi:hypothetical protein